MSGEVGENWSRWSGGLGKGERARVELGIERWVWTGVAKGLVKMACEDGHGENMQNFLINFWGKG